MKQSKPRPLDRMLLRLLLLWLFLPSLIVTLFAVGLTGYLWGRGLGERQLLLAHSLAHTVDDYVEHAIRVLGTVGQLAETSTPEELTSYMYATWQTYGYFDIFYRLDESDTVTLLVPLDHRYQELDMSSQPHFRPARAQTDVTISRPFISLHTGQPAVYMVWPLSDGGVVVGELNLGALQEAIAAGGGGQYFIADHSGTLLAHPQSDLVAQQVNVNHMEIVQRGLTGEATLLYSTDGVFVLGSTAQVECTGWVVVVQTPLSVAYGPYVGAMALTLVLAPTVWLAMILHFRQQLEHHVVAPLARLSHGVEALAAGDFTQAEALAAIPAAFAEVNVLAADFERMSQAIQARQDALQKSEEKYRTILENIEDGYYEVDIVGNFTFFNDALCRILGYTEDELMGMNNRQYMDEEVAKKVYRTFNDVYRTGKPAKVFDWELVRKDGTRRFIEASTSLISDSSGEPVGFRGICRDITERKRAEEALKHRLEQLAALSQASQAVTASLELDQVLARIVSLASKVVASDYTGVVLVDEAGSIGQSAEDLPGVPALEYRIRDEGLTSWIVRSRQAVVIDEIGEDGTITPALGEGAPCRVNPFIVEAGVKSIAGLPLMVKDRLLGVLYPHSLHIGAFRGQLPLLTALANQAAIAIENSRLFQAEREQRELAEALAQAAAAVSSILDLDQVLDRILEQVERVVPGDAFNVMLVENNSARTVRQRGYVRLGLKDQSFDFAGSIAEYPNLLNMVQTGKPAVTSDTTTDPDWVPLEGQEWLRSYVGAPIRVGRVTVGFLNVDGTRPGQFGPDDVRQLEAFASHVATAIENARLYTEQRLRAEEAGMLLEIANAINSTLEPDRILEEVTLRAAHACQADRCTILLLDEDGEVLHPIMSQFASGRVDRKMWRLFKNARYPQRVEDIPGAIQVIQERRPLFIPDAQASSVPLRWIEPFDVGSMLVVPLVSREQTIGMMVLDRPEIGREFTREQVNLAVTIGGQAAVAIENAGLHRKLQDHAYQLEQRVQKRTAQLQAQYARLEAILSSASDGIIVANAGGEILQTNLVADTWLTQTLSPEDAARLQEAVRDLARQTEERPQTALELTGLDLELSAAPVVEEEVVGEPTAVVAIHDVSHLKTLDRMKTRFVTNVSHELRTPVTTIKLYAALMQRTSPEKWGEYLDTLAQETDRLAQLVESILQISRIDAGRLEMKPRPTPFNGLTEAVIASHTMLAQERGLTLEHRPAEPGPVALVDPDQVMQVLNNLVENSIHYTPEGGKVTISTGREEADGRVWATVTVTDTGMGIPEEELPHIFERFFRGEEPRTMQMSGTGLGLAIVKEIVELHGGQVTVESEREVGTTFTVRLPLVEGEA